MDLSVIIPYAGEYPAILFTIMSVHEELKERGIYYEIITVDNDCQEWRVQLKNNHAPQGGAFYSQMKLDKEGHEICISSEAIKAVAGRHHKWLKNVEYTERLSHWQAKNVGVRASTGNIIWFCDAHVAVPRGALWKMYQLYRDNYDKFDGTLHFANTYRLMEDAPQAYKLNNELSTGFIGYSLTPYRHFSYPYQVPCASSCGMMMTRKLWDSLGGWPQRYAYSGGEHFINFVLATMGKNKWMFTGGWLRHHGAPRDYHYTSDGMIWNRCAAMYMVGGVELATKYISCTKGRPGTLKTILASVLAECSEQRKLIKDQQVIDIGEWAKQWEGVMPGERALK